jgi:hypothetical protein
VDGSDGDLKTDEDEYQEDNGDENDGNEPTARCPCFILARKDSKIEETNQRNYTLLYCGATVGS